MIELIRLRLEAESLRLSPSAEQRLTENFELGERRMLEGGTSFDDPSTQDALETLASAVIEVARRANVGNIDADIVSEAWSRICPLFPFC